MKRKASMQEDPEDVKVRKQTPTKENLAPVSATAVLLLNSSVNFKIPITRRFLIRIPLHTIQLRNFNSCIRIFRRGRSRGAWGACSTCRPTQPN